MNNNQELENLYDRYLKNDLSYNELQYFLQQIKQPQNEQLFNELMNNTWAATGKQTEQGEHLQSATVIEMPAQKTKRIFLKKWVVAAAVILLVASGAIYLLLFRTNTHNLVATNKNDQKEHTVIQPGGDKAQLLFDDGTAIILDTAKNGIVTQANGVVVTKSGDGKMAYVTKGSENKVHYGTMITPRGGQYQLTLADGSKAWLNAASSVKFPSAFTGKAREVEITGEVYFEVAKNKAMPFKVKANGALIEVLGTHFNVNAYDDESAIKTTLLEGKVKVVNRQSSMVNSESAILKPGEQAVFAANSPLTIDHSPDIGMIMAWKDGVFRFKDTDIKAIMRQAARWYDVDVVYAGEVNKSFTGVFSKNIALTEFLKFIEETESLRFKIEGRKITVIP